MPTRPARHVPQRSTPRERRGTAARRGYAYAWQKYRAWYLSRPENVLCAACKRAVATVVDHVIPHRGDPDLFWESSNHQPLCRHCHGVKTGRGE